MQHVAVAFRLDGVGAVAVGDDLGVCRRGAAPVIGGDQTRQRILRVGLLKFHGVFAFGEELGEPCAVALLSGFVQTAVRYGCCTAEGGSREGDGVAVLGNKGDACFLGGAQQGGRCLVAGHAGNVGVVDVGVRQEFPVVQDQSGEIDDQQNGSGGNAGDDADVPDGVRSCAGTAAGGFLAVSAVILVGVIRTGCRCSPAGCALPRLGVAGTGAASGCSHSVLNLAHFFRTGRVGDTAGWRCCAGIGRCGCRLAVRGQSLFGSERCFDALPHFVFGQVCGCAAGRRHRFSLFVQVNRSFPPLLRAALGICTGADSGVSIPCVQRSSIGTQSR